MAKIILPLTWLLLTLLVQPTYSTPFSPLIATAAPKETLCNLPAANNFKVTSTTSYSVSMAWDAVPGAVAYYVVALDNVSQLVVDDETVTTTNATLYPTPGSTVDLQVYAICPDQTMSTAYAEVSNFTLIITELVLELSAPCQTPVYSSAAFYSGTVNVPWQDGYTYWFDVVERNTRKVARYELKMEDIAPNQEKLTIRKVPETYYSSNAWYSHASASDFGSSNFQAPPPTRTDFEKMQVGKPYEELDSNYVLPVYWVQFQLLNVSSQPDLAVSFEQKNTNYAVMFPFGAECEGTSLIDNQSESRMNVIQPVDKRAVFAASPFSTTLRVGNLATESSTVRFTLCDLSGRTVLQRSLPAAPGYDLPTETLAPGFYLLHIEHGASRQVLKVVKN